MIPAVDSQHQKIKHRNGFYTTKEMERKRKESHAHLVSSNPLNQSRIVMEKFQNALTVYPAKGLTGSINSNFYEFLTMGMVPYVIGSGMMMAVFNSASKFFEPAQSLKASSIGRKMAMGVLFYGVMKSLSKKFIEYPLYLKTGIDINLPYKQPKAELPEAYNAEGRKAIEYHKVFESVDFPRWDLLYDVEKGKPRNHYYDTIAKKMGLGQNLVDSDQEVKPKIRETVIRTRTMSTLSSYIWAGLGVAVAVQDKWDEAFKTNHGKLKIFSKDFVERFGKGLKGSIKELYQGGVYKSPVKAAAGKAFIFSAIASSVLGATFSMYDFFGKRADVVKGKIDYDKDYTVG